MDILLSIIIGAIGCIIGPKIQIYIEKKIKLKWLCWILTFIITIIIITIPLLVVRYLIFGHNLSNSSAI